MTEKLKPSQYNYLFKMEDNTRLAYNAYSGAFVEIDDINYSDFQKLLEDPQTYIENGFNKQLVEIAKKANFIIDDELNEFELIKLRANVSKYSTDLLQITMMPTLDCNFRCSYCYESLKKQKMKKEYRDRFKIWINNKLKSTRFLNIGWFGGEPLMVPDIMREIMSEIKIICKKRGIIYGGSVTTNGYYLTNKIVDELESFEIKTIQVTLDGPPEIHNKYRILKNGKGTFDKIIKNLTNLCTNKKDIDLIIRVNFDETSYPFIEKDFFNHIPEIVKNNSRIYFRQTFAPPVWWDETKPKKESSIPQNTKNIDFMNLNKMAQEKGFIIFVSNIQPVGGGYCEADYLNHFIVDPKCNLHKCTVAFDDKHRIGYIDEKGKEILNIPMLAKWMSRDIFHKEHCKKCKLLSLCMGGCGFSNLCNEEKNYCAVIGGNENIIDNLKILYKNHLISNQKINSL